MFKYERKINYYETDKMGVVHHSNYIRFLEEARCSWLESMDLSMELIEKMGFTIPTLEVNCKYKTHITSGDKIIINLVISEFNGVRMTVKYTIVNKENDSIVAEAYTKHCFTDKNLKPINMKKKNEKIYSIFNNLLEN